MNQRKLFIADASRPFCDALTQTLGNAYHIETATQGPSALEAILDFQPDILVLDLMLPGLDGISILQQSILRGCTPSILATTQYLSDYILQTAENFSIGYLMLKPCHTGAVVARIHDLAQRLSCPSFAQSNPRSQVSQVLLSMGFPPKLRGYTYLREAVLLMAENPRQSVTKELYPAVAGRCGATVMQIERSIRSAIGCAWEQGDSQIWQFYFPYAQKSFSHRPTNATVISRLADLVSTDCRV